MANNYKIDRAADVTAKLINVLYNEDNDVALGALGAAKALIEQRNIAEMKEQLSMKLMQA